MEAEAPGWRHASKSRPPCARRLRVKTHRQRKQRFRPTMWVDRAWNYYHLRFWMKERKHRLNKKRAPFHFNCVVRTTGTIPQMISSTSKEFTFRRRINVPLLCRDTVFRTKRRIVCLVGLFIFVHRTIVLNKQKSPHNGQQIINMWINWNKIKRKHKSMQIEAYMC